MSAKPPLALNRAVVARGLAEILPKLPTEGTFLMKDLGTLDSSLVARKLSSLGLIEAVGKVNYQRAKGKAGCTMAKVWKVTESFHKLMEYRSQS